MGERAVSVVSPRGGGGMSSEHLHLGKGKASFKDTIARNVRVWVNVWVWVRALTTVILSLEPSSSHLSRYFRPFWPTAIQGASSVKLGWEHRTRSCPQVLEHTKLTSNVVVLWFTSYLFGVPNNKRFMNNIIY